MNTYICFYKTKRKEIKATTTLEAQRTAASEFKAKHSWEVDVILCKKGNKEVIHTADFQVLICGLTLNQTD